MMSEFFIATADDIKNGRVTDIYFVRTKRILEQDGLDNVKVAAEFTVSATPQDYRWVVFGGIRETLKLLEGLPVDVWALPEGTIFRRRDDRGIRVPVMIIMGQYTKFGIYETPILGFLAAASGYLTKAARIRKAAGSIPVINFGARRTHPAIASVCDFYSYIGGFDAVSNILGAEYLGKKPTGTMPHALLIIYRFVRGDHSLGWKAYDKYLPEDVPRIMLCDTFSDEVEETIKAVETLGLDRIYGVRLDTPGSRKGNFADIVREVKWKLKQKGYDKVKIFLSGGINEYNMKELIEAGADGFGVGSAIANAPFIDYAMDIVAMERDGNWIPISKRGKYSGLKKVWFKDEDTRRIIVTPWNEDVEDAKMVLVKYMENGKIVRELPTPEGSREYVLKQLKLFSL